MTREMEYAKCIAVLSKIYRLGLLSEAEYNEVRRKLMDKYFIIHKTE